MLKAEDDLEPIDRCPYMDPRVIEVFQEVFPDKASDPASTERQDMFNAGIQHVLVFMRRVADHQAGGD